MVVELRFSLASWKKKGILDYRPGQYVQILCPQISKLQWHPFTLSSGPEEKYLSVHILCQGDWTRSLLNFVQKSKKRLDARPHLTSYPDVEQFLPTFYVAGPYTTTASSVFDYETCVLVGAGVGVTPFISILKSLR